MLAISGGWECTQGDFVCVCVRLFPLDEFNAPFLIDALNAAKCKNCFTPNKSPVDKKKHGLLVSLWGLRASFGAFTEIAMLQLWWEKNNAPKRRDCAEKNVESFEDFRVSHVRFCAFYAFLAFDVCHSVAPQCFLCVAHVRFRWFNSHRQYRIQTDPAYKHTLAHIFQ